VLTRRDILIVFAVMVPSLLAGCKPGRPISQAVTDRFLLLEARLEQTHLGNTEVVSKVRFIAESDAAASVFLPCADGFGIAIAFLPEVSTEDQIVLSRANYTEKFYDEDILGDYADWPSHYAERNGGALATFRGDVGEDIVFARGSKRRNNNAVSYQVIVNCRRLVDHSDLKHVESSLFELDGERLHRINAAIPEVMSAGVEFGPENRKGS
jgi:hypothetical protein